MSLLIERLKLVQKALKFAIREPRICMSILTFAVRAK